MKLSNSFGMAIAASGGKAVASPANNSPSYTPPLDVVTGAQTAFSLARKLNTSYLGNAFRIRRSNDDVEIDIQFEGNGEVSEAAISSFVGSNSAYVVKVYDQSGNTNDWSTAVAADQPRIVNAGVLEKYNGKLAMYSTGSDNLECTANGVNPSTLHVVGGGNTNLIVLLSSPGAAGYCGVSYDGLTAGSYAYSGSPSMYVNGSIIGTTMDNLHDATNGHQSVIVLTNLSLATNYIGYKLWFGGSYTALPYIQEYIIYGSDKASDRSTLETNATDFYSIPITI